MGSGPWGGSEELWRSTAVSAVSAGHQVLTNTIGWPQEPVQLRDLRSKGAQVTVRRPVSHGLLDRIARRVQHPMAKVLAFSPDAVCINQGATYDAAEDVYVRWLIDQLRTQGVPYTLICECEHTPAALTESQRRQFSSLFRNAACVAFLAQRLIAHSERHLGMSLPNAVVVRNPVNLSDRSSCVWPSANGPRRLATVARLQANYKCQPNLFEALSSEAWKHRDWVLGIYGTGPDEAFLKASAKHYGIENRVEFHGFVDDVRQVWSRDHLMILPSRAEGVPLSMVEAMLCSRPVLVTDVGGNREWVTEGETGFIAESWSVESVGSALERAWQAIPQWETMGRAAHESATRMVDEDPGKSLLKLIESTV